MKSCLWICISVFGIVNFVSIRGHYPKLLNFVIDNDPANGGDLTCAYKSDDNSLFYVYKEQKYYVRVHTKTLYYNASCGAVNEIEVSMFNESESQYKTRKVLSYRQEGAWNYSCTFYPYNCNYVQNYKCHIKRLHVYNAVKCATRITVLKHGDTPLKLDAHLKLNERDSTSLDESTYEFNDKDSVTFSCYTYNGIWIQLSYKTLANQHNEKGWWNKNMTTMNLRLTKYMDGASVTCEVAGSHYNHIPAQIIVKLSMNRYTSIQTESSAPAVTPTTTSENVETTSSTAIVAQSHNTTPAPAPSESSSVLLIVVPVIVVILLVPAVLWLAFTKCSKKHKKRELEMDCQNLSEDLEPTASGGQWANSHNTGETIGSADQNVYSVPLTKLNTSKNLPTKPKTISTNITYENLNNKQLREPNYSTLQNRECNYAALDLPSSDSSKFVPIVEPNYITIQQGMAHALSENFKSHTSSGNNTNYQNCIPKIEDNRYVGDHKMSQQVQDVDQATSQTCNANLKGMKTDDG